MLLWVWPGVSMNLSVGFQNPPRPDCKLEPKYLGGFQHPPRYLDPDRNTAADSEIRRGMWTLFQTGIPRRILKSAKVFGPRSEYLGGFQNPQRSFGPTGNRDNELDFNIRRNIWIQIGIPRRISKSAAVSGPKTGIRRGMWTQSRLPFETPANRVLSYASRLPRCGAWAGASRNFNNGAAIDRYPRFPSMPRVVPIHAGHGPAMCQS